MVLTFIKTNSFIIMIIGIIQEQIRRLGRLFTTVRNDLPILFHKCLTSKFTVSLPFLVLLYGFYENVEITNVYSVSLNVFQPNIAGASFILSVLFGLLISCAVFKRVTGLNVKEVILTLANVRSSSVLLIALPVLNGGIN